MPKSPDRAKFVELVEPRTSAVLDRLDVLGKLARPRDYAFTAADVDAIEAAIINKVGEVMGNFRNPEAATHEPTFKLGADAPTSGTPKPAEKPAAKAS